MSLVPLLVHALEERLPFEIPRRFFPVLPTYDSAHLVTLRVDPFHGCDASSPFSNGTIQPVYFRGTAVAVLDRSFAVLGWTWLVVDPAGCPAAAS